MSTTITIDIPEVALFDSQELRLKLSNYIKSLSAKMHRSAQPAVETHRVSWRQMTISPEVKAMTFDERVDLGTTSYDEILEKTLEEKYL